MEMVAGGRGDGVQDALEAELPELPEIALEDTVAVVVRFRGHLAAVLVRYVNARVAVMKLREPDADEQTLVPLGVRPDFREAWDALVSDVVGAVVYDRGLLHEVLRAYHLIPIFTIRGVDFR